MHEPIMLLWTYSFCIQMLSLYQVLMQERRNLFYQIDDNGVIFQADGESSKDILWKRRMACSSNEQFSIDKSMTLDLNGYSIGSIKEQSFVINKYGETTEVKQKNGTITNDSSESDKLSIPMFARQRVKLHLENMKLILNPNAGMMGYGLRIGNGDHNQAP